MSQAQVSEHNRLSCFCHILLQTVFTQQTAIELHLSEVVMDLFLLSTVLFLLANVAVVITMLRRVNLNNDSVLAWEHAQVAVLPATTLPVPATAFQPAYLAEAA
jgi:hypothetical protein